MSDIPQEVRDDMRSELYYRKVLCEIIKKNKKEKQGGGYHNNPTSHKLICNEFNRQCLSNNEINPDTGISLFLEGPLAETAKTISKYGFEKKNCIAINNDKDDIKYISGFKTCTPVHIEFSDFIREEYENYTNKPIAHLYLDTNSTINGKKTFRPMKDLEYMFENNMFADKAIVSLTFSRRGVKGSPESTYRKVNNNLKKYARKNGYRITIQYIIHPDYEVKMNYYSYGHMFFITYLVEKIEEESEWESYNEMECELTIDTTLSIHKMDKRRGPQPETVKDLMDIINDEGTDDIVEWMEDDNNGHCRFTIKDDAIFDQIYKEVRGKRRGRKFTSKDYYQNQLKPLWRKTWGFVEEINDDGTVWTDEEDILKCVPKRTTATIIPPRRKKRKRFVDDIDEERSAKRRKVDDDMIERLSEENNRLHEENKRLREENKVLKMQMKGLQQQFYMQTPLQNQMHMGLLQQLHCPPTFSYP